MWLAYACGSAFFAGITAILAKVGIKKIDSDLATATDDCSIDFCMDYGTAYRILYSNRKYRNADVNLSYIIGIATGASWLCYFRALQLGDVNKVTPIVNPVQS